MMIFRSYKTVRLAITLVGSPKNRRVERQVEALPDDFFLPDGLPDVVPDDFVDPIKSSGRAST